jgi:hypothetical protein
VSDIVDWLRVVSDSYGMGRCEEALEEIERLREALERIAHVSEKWTDSLVSQINEIARAALPKGENDDTENM